MVWFTTNGMCVKNNTIMYVARRNNNRVIPLEWSWWVTSNDAGEPGEQLIVLANGDHKSDLVGWSLLLLAATVRSSAHMPLGISDRNTIITLLLPWAYWYCSCRPTLRLTCPEFVVVEVFRERQCRINNSSKCRNCYGPPRFLDTAVFCVKFVFHYMHYWNLGARGKLLESEPYILHMLYINCVHWKQIKFFNMSGN